MKTSNGVVDGFPVCQRCNSHWKEIKTKLLYKSLKQIADGALISPQLGLTIAQLSSA